MIKKCPICLSDSRFFIKANDRFKRDDFYSYDKCNSCNLVFSIERNPNQGFHTYNNSESDSKAQQIVFSIFYKRLTENKKGKLKILDYGAGTGKLSKFLIRKGHEVSAYELDGDSILSLNKIEGLKVFSTLKEIENDYYDIIIMEQVAEHLKDPLETIRLLKEKLNNHGIFLISLPNINGLQFRLLKNRWFHFDAPRHLNHYYKKSFENLCKKLDLKIIKRYYFNIHLDPSGWFWSFFDFRRYPIEKISTKIILALFLPLSILTGITKSSSYVLYVIRK